LLRFLDLQQQWRIVVGYEQANCTERADAADPDNLEGDVAQMVALQQYAPVLLQGLGIRREGLVRVELVPAQMPHQRRLVPDTPMPACHFNEAKMLFPGCQHLGEALPQVAPDLGGVDVGDGADEVDAHVPRVEWRQAGQLMQLFAITLRCDTRETPAIAIRHCRNASSDEEAGG
jgi:hypothetical protein